MNEKYDPQNNDVTMLNLEESVGEIPTMRPNGKSIGTVDRYELLEKLGQGGFGAVYGARDTEAGVLVALKLLPNEISCDEEEMAEIRKNFALVSRLHHPNVVSLLYMHRVTFIDHKAQSMLGIRENDYLVVMEYAPGATLFALLRTLPLRKMEWSQALKICSSIAEALDYAHSQKVLHRDIKPKNIMVSREGNIKVLDFGLAAEIRSSMSRKSKEPENKKSGTPLYMAPEQWAGRKQDGRADQYALAVIFYELIGGVVPFKSSFDSGNFEIMRGAVLKNVVEPLQELTKKQNKVLKRALSKEPKERFNSCKDFVEALRGKKASKPQKIRTPKKSSMNWGKVAQVVLLVVVLGLAGGVGVWWKIQRDINLEKQNQIESQILEERARVLKVDATIAYEKVGVDITNRGQGFEEKFQAVNKDLRVAKDAYVNESWEQSIAMFEMVKSACVMMHVLDALRQDAQMQQERADVARRNAEAVKPDKLVSTNWKKGLALFHKAEKAFNEGAFEKASKDWSKAVDEFVFSEKYGQVITAKTAYENALRNGEYKKEDFLKYVPSEWAAVEAAVLSATKEKNNPEQEKLQYEIALAKYLAAENALKTCLFPRLKLKCTPSDVVVVLKSNRTGLALDVSAEEWSLEKDQSYTLTISKKTFRTFSETVTVDWRGLKEKNVLLKQIMLPNDLEMVPDATYASLNGLELGSGKAQALQKKAVEKSALSLLEVETTKTGIRFSLIPPGIFIMGSNFLNERKRDRDENQYKIRIKEAFYCGKYEVTQAQWNRVMSKNPSRFNGEQNPVERVSWDDCQRFVKKLCKIEGVPQGTYRLLTEAEWEYACRAGTTGEYAGKLDAMAWYGTNSRSRTHPVGINQPNAWGLYDMHGNVWEWCIDKYKEQYKTDSKKLSASAFRIRRGGSWRDTSRSCRSAERGGSMPNSRYSNIGFRLFRKIPKLQ